MEVLLRSFQIAGKANEALTFLTSISTNVTFS